jgi:uncharacterized protein YjiK
MTNTEVVKNKDFKVIAIIPEASGICLVESSNTFFVVSDEWKISEISNKWKILREKKIWKYDFEWIVCDEKNKKLYLLIEETWNLLSIFIDDLKVDKLITLDISNKEREKYFDSKSWAEWVAIIWDTIFISTQKKDKNLLEFSFSKSRQKLKLEKIYDIKSHDLSGMTFYNKSLYILSDEKNEIYVYDINKEKIKETIQLEKWDWEGIIFDKKWQLYLADDSWRVVEYDIVK